MKSYTRNFLERQTQNGLADSIPIGRFNPLTIRLVETALKRANQNHRLGDKQKYGEALCDAWYRKKIGV
jgi:hypothetical protein